MTYDYGYVVGKEWRILQYKALHSLISCARFHLHSSDKAVSHLLDLLGSNIILYTLIQLSFCFTKSLDDINVPSANKCSF